MGEIAATSKRLTAYRDWTHGSVLKNLLMLSWPMVVMESMWVISQIVDLVWIGRLGSNALAGVGLANIMLNMVMAVDMGLVVGVRAIIARHVGAGDYIAANRVAAQSVLIGAVWGMVVTVFGLLLAGPVLSLFGVDAEALKQGTAFMQVMFAGWLGLEVLVFGLYSIQASGDTVTPMAVEMSIRILHVVLCPFLVMGYWIFPRLEVRGAALSNVVAQVIGALVVSIILFRGRSRLSPRLRDLKFAPRVAVQILKVGVPALLMNMQSAFAGMLLMGLVVPFGTVAVASHSLASRVEMFLFVPGMGLGAGAGVLVGHNLGAGRPDRATRGAWLGLGIVQCFMMACCIVILVWAERLVGVFSSDPQVVKTGAEFLRIATAGYLVMAFSAVLQNSIAGAGDTVPNMVVSIASVWLIQLPLAYLLSRPLGFGIYGVRWALVVSGIASGIAFTAYFVRGRWKTRRL